jgi:phage shock protein PspC (stress-responsive transcriptional regulator)
MKKIYRLREGKKIAGICAGIADMYNFDVTIVRIAVVFLTVLTQVFPGVVAYLVGWYLMPERDHAQSPDAVRESE